jgi:peptidylprolyl isomerase
MSNTVQSRNNAPRALAGALAGVALVVVLAIVFFVVRSSGDDKTPAASAPAASAPADSVPPDAAQPPSGPAQPDVPIDPRLQKEPVVKAGTGTVKALKVTPLVAGRGPAVAAGQTLTVNYTGVTYKDGKVFDSSWQRGEPVTFPIGVGQLIKGWDEGLVGVKVGSRVQLDVPSDKAYGDNPEGGRPPGDLRFVVDVIRAS